MAWFVPRKRPDYAAWLQTYAEQPDTAGVAQEPVYRQYELLRRSLLRYRDLETRGGWTTLAAPRAGQSPDSLLVREVRRRLILLGDSDGSFTAALQNFQERMGLPVNGRLTPENNRAFSLGCIRWAEPAKLAGWILRTDPSWNAVRIAEAMKAGKEKWVDAPGNVHVFIVYFTAWVDRQGRLNFRHDVYGRDKRLAGSILP